MSVTDPTKKPAKRPAARAAVADRGLPIAPSIPLELVEWKIDSDPQQRASGPMCRFVPYIDGRDVARLFDEWVGPMNWSDAEHGGGYDEAMVSGEAGMWCSIAVREPGTDEWLVKSDFGRPSSYEKGKGLVSDAFKRCAIIKWGVGRNVYDLPNVTAPVRVWQPSGGGKAKAFTTDETLPHILAELKRLGFEASGGRVETHDEISHQQEVEDDTSPHADRPSRSTPGQAARQARNQRVPDASSTSSPVKWPNSLPGVRGMVAQRLDAIEPQPLRAVAKQAFQKAFKVPPTDIKAKDVPKVKAFIEAVEQCKSVADVAAKAQELGVPPEVPPDEPMSDYDRAHLALVVPAVAALTNAALEDAMSLAGLAMPTERADAERALVEHELGLLRDEFPEDGGPLSAEQFAEWWAGQGD